MSLSRVRCRRIDLCDLDRVADLLVQGFATRPRSYWVNALTRLQNHPTPETFPKFGSVLECDESLAGALLTIFTSIPQGDQNIIRCNLSSWYVSPPFRSFGSFLNAHAQRFQGVTYINTSPAPHTLPLIEAQGFKRFTDGVFLAAAASVRAASSRTTIYEYGKNNFPFKEVPASELQLFDHHHSYGCYCIWCEDGNGGSPFIYKRRYIMRRTVPCAHVIYCRDVADLSNHAAAVSRYIMLKGMPFMTVGSNGRVVNFAGQYFAGFRPMYYRGADAARAGDVAYTEGAIFGM